MSTTDQGDAAATELAQLDDPTSFESWNGRSAAPAAPAEDPATVSIPVVAAQPASPQEPASDLTGPSSAAAGPSPGATPPSASGPVGLATSTPAGVPASAAPVASQHVVRPAPTGPRRVRLVASRVDPWSVMKVSFLLSVALAVAGVVTVAALWSILSGLGIFTKIDELIRDNQLAGSSPVNVLDYVGFGRVVSLAVVISVIDVILLTAIATLGAFLYNITSALVGGIQVTLTDD